MCKVFSVITATPEWVIAPLCNWEDFGQPDWSEMGCKEGECGLAGSSHTVLGRTLQLWEIRSALLSLSTSQYRKMRDPQCSYQNLFSPKSINKILFTYSTPRKELHPKPAQATALLHPRAAASALFLQGSLEQLSWGREEPSSGRGGQAGRPSARVSSPPPRSSCARSQSPGRGEEGG